MAKAKSFRLGETCEGMLANLVASGRFETETEALRAGIRMLADYEAKMDALRSKIDKGDADIAAGRVTEYASAEDLTNDILQRGLEKLNRKD